jgi:uncharacterized membrane protein SirB2
VVIYSLFYVIYVVINLLKIQLRQERTEERRKMFKIVERRLENHETPFARWKKILPGIGTNKLVDVTIENGKTTLINLSHLS